MFNQNQFTMEKETIKFEDFATFRAMVSGAVVKYYDCAVDYIPLITERNNMLQCRELYEASDGEFRLIPKEYKAEVCEALEVDGTLTTKAVYAFGSVVQPSFICFAYDVADGKRTELSFYQERKERLARLREMYIEFRMCVNADIERCRAEVANFEDMEEWGSVDIEMLKHLSNDLELHFRECEQWLNHHIKTLES